MAAKAKKSANKSNTTKDSGVRPLRPVGEVGDNPIGLSKKTAELLAVQLDRHTASLFILFHQYQKHHWLVEGPQFRDLHLFLGEYYEQVHESVDKVAERLTAIGGIPTSNPVEQAKIAYIVHEAEGMFPIRKALEKNMADEGKIAVELRKTIRDAYEHGDYGTKALLEGILILAEDRAHHLEHFLGDDTLERNR